MKLNVGLEMIKAASSVVWGVAGGQPQGLSPWWWGMDQQSEEPASCIPYREEDQKKKARLSGPQHTGEQGNSAGWPTFHSQRPSSKEPSKRAAADGTMTSASWEGKSRGW